MWSDGAGRRLNKSCTIVLRFLKDIQKLYSVQEICFALKEELGADAPSLTTVYRAIDSLLGLNLIQEVDLRDGEKRYEPIESGVHHHHLICIKCKNSIHLDQCLIETLATTVEARHGFKVRSHVLEIFGHCESCAATHGNENGS